MGQKLADMGQIEKSCENCRAWLPMGGCSFGGFMPCDKWERSLSYPINNEPTLW